MQTKLPSDTTVISFIIATDKTLITQLKGNQSV